MCVSTIVPEYVSVCAYVRVFVRVYVCVYVHVLCLLVFTSVKTVINCFVVEKGRCSN